MISISKSDKLFQTTVLITLFVGIVLMSLSFIGIVTKATLFPLLLLSLFVIYKIVKFILIELRGLERYEYYLFSLLLIIWSFHFIQVLIPETGFDALWYHLPVLREIVKSGGISYMPDLYQSLNPLFADLYFILGYVYGGYKLVAYMFGVLLIFASYKLSRLFLNRLFSLAVIVLISTFQVVSWQSSSFYIDIPKAFFEVAGLWFLFNQKTDTKSVKSSLLFGASLATKLFSLLLLPVFILLQLLNMKELAKGRIFRMIIILILLPIPFYIFSYIHTGSPVYSFNVNLGRLGEIGGRESNVSFILSTTALLPTLPLALAIARDYISPFISLLFIPIALKFKNIVFDKKSLSLLIFTISQLVLWWYLPPLSTRYALSGFITFTILGVLSISEIIAGEEKKKKLFLYLLIFISLINFVPRLIVAKRSLTYLFSSQTQRKYLEEFYDGNIDDQLNSWYGY